MYTWHWKTRGKQESKCQIKDPGIKSKTIVWLFITLFMTIYIMGETWMLSNMPLQHCHFKDGLNRSYKVWDFQTLMIPSEAQSIVPFLVASLNTGQDLSIPSMGITCPTKQTKLSSYNFESSIKKTIVVLYINLEVHQQYKLYNYKEKKNIISRSQERTMGVSSNQQRNTGTSYHIMNKYSNYTSYNRLSIS